MTNKLLEKLALAAWKRPANLTQANLSRLATAAGLQPGNMNPGAIQRGLQAFSTDLSPAQLQRHRQLQAKLTPALMKHYDVTPHNYPKIGPAGNAKFMFIDPDAGTMYRRLLDSENFLDKFQANREHTSGKNYTPIQRQKYVKPYDAGITNSIIKHERGEQAMSRGMGEGKYAPNHFATHIGPHANLAERLGIRDPEVRAFMDRARVPNPGDVQSMKILRNAGMVGNYVPPVGGRAIRHAERKFETMPLNLLSAAPAIQNRVSVGRPSNTPSMANYMNDIDRILEVGQKYRDYLPKKLNLDLARANMAALTRLYSNDPSLLRYNKPMKQDAVRDYIARFSGL